MRLLGKLSLTFCFLITSWSAHSANFDEDAFLKETRTVADSSNEEEPLEELSELKFEEKAPEEKSDSPYDDLDFSDDIKTIPERSTPKINPDTQIVTTKKGRYIYHPNQEKGLYKINRENEYLYKYKKSKLQGFLHIKGGNLNFSNFPTKEDEVRLETLYNKTQLLTFFLEYEWQPFKKHRSLSVKVGGGLAYGRGKGRFVDGSLKGQISDQESVTLLMFPISAGLVYKFKFLNNQLFMPFVSGAIDYNLATEFGSNFSLDFKGLDGVKYNGILAGHFGGGVLLNLGWLEKSAALELDKEFGINNVYLSLEGRQIVSFYNDRDITGFAFVAGLSFEY